MPHDLGNAADLSVSCLAKILTVSLILLQHSVGDWLNATDLSFLDGSVFETDCESTA